MAVLGWWELNWGMGMVVWGGLGVLGVRGRCGVEGGIGGYGG